MMEGATFELDNLVTNLRNEGEYFLDFLRVRHLEAGIIVLDPGVEDTQTLHDSDELYYVISGSGLLTMGKKEVKVKQGSILFVPSNMEHKFHGNSDTLVVLYMFAEE